MDKFCTNCGTKIDGTYKFCPSCGTSVAKQEEAESISASTKFMEYKIAENGEEVFCLNVTIGKGESVRTVQVEHAKGNGAKLCKNGIGAMEALKKDGYVFKNVEMPVLLNAKFDLYAPDCEVLSADVIAKLYKANTFFSLLGYDLSWRDLPAFFDRDFSDFSQLDLVNILVSVMKKKMNMDLPLEDGDKLRIGESLLLCANYDGALEWFKDFVENNGDNDGYSCNILGQIYLFLAKNTEGSVEAYYENAVEWLRRSAERTNVLGLINLARLYEEGIGIERNVSEALQRYLLAYKQGSEHAVISFKRFMKTNFVDIHETGFVMPDEYDYEGLADECEKEASENDSLSLLNIAYMYHHGLGRRTSLEKAIDYYKKTILDGRRYGSYAIAQLDKIRQEGNTALIDNDSLEQTLKRAAMLAKLRRDAVMEKRYIKEEKYGAVKPKKPEYTSCWVLGGEAKDYNENDCYTQEELRLELQVYARVSEIFDAYKNQWEKRQEAKLSELDQKINDADSELMQLEPYIARISHSENTRIEALAFACEYSEKMGVTIEEGLFEYEKTKSADVGTVEDNKVVIPEGKGFSIVKPVTEVLGNLSEIEKKITQLKKEDERHKKSILGINKPIKPALRQVIHKDAPSSVYRGRICETEQEYRTKLAVFFEELSKYYSDRLQLLDTLPNRRVEIKKQIAKLDNEAFHLYARMDFPTEYRNQEALDYIRNHIETMQCTLQAAYDEYETYKKLEKQKAERELARRQRQEAEQERIRVENAKRKMEQWDREYEEQERRARERERAYDEKYGKKDLLGSTVCIKRFQTGPFDFKHSCTFCPQARNCTRA